MRGTCRPIRRSGTQAILSLTVSKKPPAPRTAAGMRSRNKPNTSTSTQRKQLTAAPAEQGRKVVRVTYQSWQLLELKES